MKKTPAELIDQIKSNVHEGITDILKQLNIDISNPVSQEKHTEILLNGWQIITKIFMNRWIPQLTDDEEYEVVSLLKQEKSMHSIKDFVKQEYKDAIMLRLGLDQYVVNEIDPDVFDKIDELSYGANIAYNTIISIMNENLEILLAKPYEEESSIREEAEDYWLNEVFERIMIEYVQYGKDIVNELDDYAKTKDFFDGFDKDMLHDIYNRLFEEKINEIKQIREINKIA